MTDAEAIAHVRRMLMEAEEWATQREAWTVVHARAEKAMNGEQAALDVVRLVYGAILAEGSPPRWAGIKAAMEKVLSK